MKKNYLIIGASFLGLYALFGYYYHHEKEMKKALLAASNPSPVQDNISKLLKTREKVLEKRKIIRSIIDTVLNNCTEMVSIIDNNDIDSIVVKINNESKYSYRREVFGWERCIEINVFVKENPKSKWIIDKYLNGHTLYYYAGGSNSPGFISGKETGDILCGMKRKKDNNISTFIRIPYFATIDSI